jgi:hypothetical protein
MQKTKRGRKPKMEKMSIIDITSNYYNEPTTTEVKNKNVYKINEEEKYNTNDSDNENIIMKLNITSTNSCELFDNTSIMLDGYTNEKCYSTYETSSIKDDESTYSDGYDDKNEPYSNNLKVVQLLKDFEEKNKLNEWPISTSISCYWCCHTFMNTPFGIPVKYVNNRFYVYGCFCSLECAAAHNNHNKNNMDDMLERYSLINLLSRKINYKVIVKPAPSKLTLTMFGGQQSIEEFRRSSESCKLVNINFPPMMTMVQQLEEINESEINNDNKYIPLDTDRILKYKEELRLKRNKPINNYKNTLDHTMNLKFTSE